MIRNAASSAPPIKRATSEPLRGFCRFVYCDYEKLPVIVQRDMISAAEYVRSFRDRQVMNRSLQLPTLPAEYEQLDRSDPDSAAVA
jgi:hypothetical protein